MMEEARAILQAVPAADLAVQWDCAIEPIVLAGGWPDHVKGMLLNFHKRVPVLVDIIPPGVEAGIFATAIPDTGTSPNRSRSRYASSLPA